MEQPRKETTESPVSKAIAKLRAEPERRWTVTQLAKAVGVSRPVLARRFVEETGLSPLRYLGRLRMERAAALLVGSTWSLSEVGAAVGYDSEFAFSRAFRRHYRRPPGLFRREQRALAARVLSQAIAPRTFCFAA